MNRRRPGAVSPLLITGYLLLCALAAAGQTQTAPLRVPQALNRGLGSSMKAYADRPPDLTLMPHGPDARAGQVWVQTVGYGLLVVGEVEGEAADFPRNRNLILEKDHVEIWLADGKDPELPPIGWGNQFDQITLPKGAESCGDWVKTALAGSADSAAGEKKCRAWAETQSHYRTYLKRLFVRQWLVTPDYAIESFATPAYEEIIRRFASDQPQRPEAPTPMKPEGKLQMWFGNRAGGKGYTFEILIPFTAFPPLSTTELRDLRLLVDVFSAAGEGKKTGGYATSSAARGFGKPETFNRLRLDPPQTFHLTPCNLPVEAKDKYGDTHAAWFIPKASTAVPFDDGAFILVNEGIGYQYQPDALSPLVRAAHFFWSGIGESEWVCGPQLSYRKGEQVQRLEAEVAEAGFEARRMPGGELLIKVGPRAYSSAFGSGQCGACPRTELRMLRMGGDSKTQEVLRLGSVVDPADGASQDFTVSPDWTQVVQYDRAGADEEGNEGRWSAVTWCWNHASYEKCGHKENVQPPNPPVLKELRETD